MPKYKFPYSLSLAFPAYNEQENISGLVRNALKVASKLTKDFEIIVVDDGSKDKTAEVAEELGKKYKQVKLIRHRKNQGYGAAVNTGLFAAKKQIVFFSDSDRQFNLKELPEFLKWIEDYDAIIGYRNPRRDSLMRLANAWGWKMLIFFLFGVSIIDIDCAFKAFKRKTLRKIKVESRGAMYSAELLIRLIGARAKMIQKPVGHYPRRAGNPTGAKPRVILRAFRELFKFRKKIRKALDPIPYKYRAIKSL